MNIIKIAIATTVLTSAFMAGAVMGKVLKKKNIVNKLKKMTIKKNLAASSKTDQD